MLESTNRSAGEDPIEQLLGSLTASPANINRDQLMFAAGMHAAQSAKARIPALTLRTRLWPVLAMVSTAAAMIFGVIVWQRPERVIVVERPVKDEVVAKQSLPLPVAPPQRATSVTPFDPALNYVHQRDLALRDGPEALPSQSGGERIAREIPTQRELLRELPGGFQQKYQVDSEVWWQAWLISGDRL